MLSVQGRTYKELLGMLATPLRKPVEIDEGAAQAALARAAKAQQLLNDEELMRAFADVEAVYMETWRTSAPFDNEVRERAWIAVKLLSDIKGLLMHRVETGRVAGSQLAQLSRD